MATDKIVPGETSAPPKSSTTEPSVDLISDVTGVGSSDLLIVERCPEDHLAARGSAFDKLSAGIEGDEKIVKLSNGVSVYLRLANNSSTKWYI